MVLPMASFAGAGMISSLVKVSVMVDSNLSDDKARRDGGKGEDVMDFAEPAGAYFLRAWEPVKINFCLPHCKYLGCGQELETIWL